MSRQLRCVTLAIVVALVARQASSLAGRTDSTAPMEPTHKEIETIGSTPQTKFANLVSFCMDKQGNLLACDAGQKHITKLSPAGKALDTWKLDFAPYAVDASSDGSIYVAGQGVVARLDDKGNILKRVQSDVGSLSTGRPSGITVTKKDVFLGVGLGWSLRSRSSIVRFTRDLTDATTIAGDLRGCCQRLDLTANDEALYIAENTRYRVLKCDREGKVLSQWGGKTRTEIEGFGSCCNPMNLCFGPRGELYTAESGLARIKRYAPDGKLLGLVGYVGTDRFNRAGRQAASCSNITVAVNKDASRIYVLDFKNNRIRVLAKTDSVVNN